MSTYKGIVYFLICPSMWYAELTSWECCPRGGSVLASCVRARALAPTNVTARTSWQCSRVSHRSLLSLYSHCILKKKKLPLALSCQGVIFLGAYNWLIPKKVLSAIRTSSAPQKAYALDFEVCNRCKLSITYLKKKFHSFLPHSYKERHQGKFLQLPLPWVMRILWTLS